MFLIVAAIFTAFPASALMLAESELQPGDLIRGETYSSVYYYGDDGLRYVFPNDKTYFTWYSDFDDVQWVSDSTLATIQIGGNVTYKPGVKMLKINSDPTVYAVADGGELRAIDSEEIAIELYGATWNQQIDDVPDGFFGNYEIGSRIELSSQYDPEAEEADAFSIATDKGLETYTSWRSLPQATAPRPSSLKAARPSASSTPITKTIPQPSGTVPGVGNHEPRRSFHSLFR